MQEYLRQGTPAGPDDDQWHRMGVDEDGKPVGPDNMDKAAKILYQRRLRDYSVEFDELARERVVLLANIAGVTKDNERLKAALVSAKALQAFREEEKRKLSIDLAGITKERAAIEKHLAHGAAGAGRQSPRACREAGSKCATGRATSPASSASEELDGEQAFVRPRLSLRWR